MPRDLHSFPTRRSSDLHVAHDLDELLAAFLGQLRDRQPDQLAVVGRREAEVGLLDRLLDAFDRARVERLHREHAGIRHIDRRRSEEHTSELQSLTNLVCHEIYTLSLHDALPISMLRTTLTSSLRRSSVSCGIGSLISLPSLDGVRPRSDSWIAFSMPLIELGSNGCTVSMRGSGTLIVEDRKSTRLNSSH